MIRGSACTNIVAEVGITEREYHRILSELVDEGYVLRERGPAEALSDRGLSGLSVRSARSVESAGFASAKAQPKSQRSVSDRGSLADSRVADREQSDVIIGAPPPPDESADHAVTQRLGIQHRCGRRRGEGGLGVGYARALDQSVRVQKQR